MVSLYLVNIFFLVFCFVFSPLYRVFLHCYQDSTVYHFSLFSFLFMFTSLLYILDTCIHIETIEIRCALISLFISIYFCVIREQEMVYNNVKLKFLAMGSLYSKISDEVQRLYHIVGSVRYILCTMNGNIIVMGVTLM